MVPIVELRGAMIMSAGWQMPLWTSLFISVIGNMLPVPVIYFFARRVLEWGSDKRYIGKTFTFFLEKGHAAGKKLEDKSASGVFLALMLFVAIPAPGTGAWTGTLAASVLDFDFKRSVLAVLLGVIIAGIIIGVLSNLGLAFIFGL
ncbi:small multi-drug export protein [Carnobacteriaceae bacterium zg-ZUI252]|nr:small multi-drug export protein [Carnobacteriaceae bacterium zg-ZUI252]MBS4770853.1 small multi-drug export protein [Carnobacteriaceae bacterium zg-ZUI240]QTU83614.1 small multi-drug export protein [Carnobacteriaceae bacterium zg-C25]